MDYNFEQDPAKLRKYVDKFKKITRGRGIKASQLSVILMKLCKKLVLSLPRKNMVFNTAKGKIYSKQSKKSAIVIKDPFIK